jgi:hypothetical protein
VLTILPTSGAFISGAQAFKVISPMLIIEGQMTDILKSIIRASVQEEMFKLARHDSLEGGGVA